MPPYHLHHTIHACTRLRVIYWGMRAKALSGCNLSQVLEGLRALPSATRPAPTTLPRAPSATIFEMVPNNMWRVASTGGLVAVSATQRRDSGIKSQSGTN